ncbi:MAG: aminodeoxychorismate synthase component I [Sphingobacteriaceae bacterium]|nr:aminodeoxychorismate synthase component I [Cytophagaceae bacterium]
MNRQAAIARMNELGKRREPFLFLIDFEEQSPLVLPLAEVDPAALWYDFNGLSNAPRLRSFCPLSVEIQPFPIAFETFRQAFDRVQAELRAGNSFLLNLTARTPITLPMGLDEVFQFSEARYKLWWKNEPESARLVAVTEFVCFSPEPFVRVESNRIAAFPMKGTTPASEGARARLLADPKEEAEHYTIVDLLRNDLSQVARRVRVERFRYIEEVTTHRGPLLQASSEIAGDLPENWPNTLGDWLFRLLPAGSVSGAPKQKTVEIIREIEGQPRGFYTGVAGIFDGKTLDSAVLIRFIERTDAGLAFRSGGGITFQSDPEAEYRELLAKIYVPIS